VRACGRRHRGARGKKARVVLGEPRGGDRLASEARAEGRRCPPPAPSGTLAAPANARTSLEAGKLSKQQKTCGWPHGSSPGAVPSPRCPHFRGGVERTRETSTASSPPTRARDGQGARRNPRRVAAADRGGGRRVPCWRAPRAGDGSSTSLAPEAYARELARHHALEWALKVRAARPGRAGLVDSSPRNGPGRARGHGRQAPTMATLANILTRWVRGRRASIKSTMPGGRWTIYAVSKWLRYIGLGASSCVSADGDAALRASWRTSSKPGAPKSCDDRQRALLAQFAAGCTRGRQGSLHRCAHRGARAS